MVLLLSLPIVERVELAAGRRVATIDIPRLLAAGWTFRQIEDQLDLIENCQRTCESQASLSPSLTAKPEQRRNGSSAR
jgi:hypothetical protein